MSEDQDLYEYFIQNFDPQRNVMAIGTCKCRNVAFANMDELPAQLQVGCDLHEHYWKDIKLVATLARIHGRPTTKKLLTALISGWKDFLSDQQIMDNHTNNGAGSAMPPSAIQVVEVPIEDMADEADVKAESSDDNGDSSGAARRGSVSIAMPVPDAEVMESSPGSWRLIISTLLGLARRLIETLGRGNFARIAIHRAWMSGSVEDFLFALGPFIQTIHCLGWCKNSLDTNNLGMLALLHTVLVETRPSANFRYAMRPRIATPSPHGSGVGEQMRAEMGRGRSPTPQRGS